MALTDQPAITGQVLRDAPAVYIFNSQTTLVVIYDMQVTYCKLGNAGVLIQINLGRAAHLPAHLDLTISSSIVMVIGLKKDMLHIMYYNTNTNCN